MAATKYLDLAGLTYFKSKLDAKFVTSADVTTAINTALETYKQGIVTIVSTLPAQGQEGILYLVPDATGGNGVYTTHAWEVVDDSDPSSPVYGFVQMGATTFSLTVDSALSSSSENPVQNKVVKGALDLKLDASELTSSIAQNGTNAVTSGAIYSALALKLDAADVDSITDADIDALFPTGSGTGS